MTGNSQLGQSIVLTIALAVIASGTWWWQAGVFRAKPTEVKSDAWDHVKEDYPLVQEPSTPPRLSAEMVDALVHANPFSSQRRLVPPPSGGDATGAGAEAIEPPKPKFAYKGHLNLGSRQRAIVEDTTTHKTHFLEVGQEVAGFKVLDITENRVVLSDLHTHEEIVLSVTSPASP